MKDKPSLKSLQGNLGLFRVRASCCPFHLRQQIQGSSHLPTNERCLLLRYLWNVGIPLESKPGNQLPSRDALVYTELFSNCCAELGVPLDLVQCSWGISAVAQRKSSHFSCLMWNVGWFWCQFRVIRPHVELILGTRSSLVLLQ